MIVRCNNCKKYYQIDNEYCPIFKNPEKECDVFGDLYNDYGSCLGEK